MMRMNVCGVYGVETGRICVWCEAPCGMCGVCGLEVCVVWRRVWCGGVWGVETCVVYMWCSDDGFVWCGGVCGVEVCVVWRCVWCTCGAVMMDLCGVCRRQAFHKGLHCVSVANERHTYTNNK